ncbi:MAG: hypothetical protein ABIJ96_00225 [Elusimicrobiota bacterium]
MLLVAALLVGWWLTAPMMGGMGSDSVDIPLTAEVNEQSLRALDPVDNPQGAPGALVGAQAADSAHSGTEGSLLTSSLYQAPGAAAGEPITKERAEEIKEEGGALAEAMARVADAGKAPDNSWGGKAARSGMSGPRAQFGKVGATREGGSGSTSAQFAVVKKAFGTGGDPGLDIAPSGGFAQGARRGMQSAGGGVSRGLNELKKMNEVSLAALKGKDETAAGGGRRTFDASGSRGGKSAMDALASAGGSAGIGNDAGVPQNLKANDPKQLNKKEFKPPEVNAGEVKNSDNQRYMEQQMMQMMLQAVLTGIMGPMGGAVGGMMSMAMQMDGPSDGNMNKL